MKVDEETPMPIARLRNEPIYYLQERYLNGNLAIVACELGESGKPNDIVDIYPITNKVELNPMLQTYWFDASRPVYTWDRDSIDKMVADFEKRARIDSSCYVNAFKVGKPTGKTNGKSQVEIAVNFYEIEVDRNSGFKHYERVCDEYERLSNMIG